jgi:AcrR family transcriptional regulator
MASVAQGQPVVTQQRILDAATERFYERGYHATTMRDIAAAVGIKAGSLYNHYSGKQEILFRLCLETSRALYEGALERLEDVVDTEERLRTYVIWHVSFHARHRHASRVADTQLPLLDDANRKAVIKLRDAHEQLLRDILERGAKQRRWGSRNLRVVSIGIETMCTEVDAWYRDDGPLSPERIGEIFAEFIRKGLGAD